MSPLDAGGIHLERAMTLRTMFFIRGVVWMWFYRMRIGSIIKSFGDVGAVSQIHETPIQF